LVSATETPQTLLAGYESGLLKELAEQISEQTDIAFVGLDDVAEADSTSNDRLASAGDRPAVMEKPSFRPGRPIDRDRDVALPTADTYVEAGLLLILAGGGVLIIAVVFLLMWFVYFKKTFRSPVGQSEGEYVHIPGRITEVLGSRRYRAEFELPVLGDRKWVVESETPLEVDDIIEVSEVYGQIIKVCKKTK
jgi:membrane protein implicated in regulation of membrane protease activity